MPENLKTLRRRVRSIRTTKQITRAMEMVSAAKLRRTSHVLSRTRPYAGTLQEMLAHLAESEEAASHPMFQRKPAGRGLLVVITSDRGLCGSFNANLLRTAERWIRQQDDRKVDLYCVGRKGLDHFRRAKASIVGHLTDLGGRLDPERAIQFTAELIQLYKEKDYSSVHVVYAKYISNVLNRPTAEMFLPIDPEALTGTGKAAEGAGRYHEAKSYLLEPSPAAVFKALVPKYLNSKIMILLAETFTSEHAARMMAMNNATSNSEELINTLTLRLNKLRQAAITKEMLEIVGGAEAQKG